MYIAPGKQGEIRKAERDEKKRKIKWMVKRGTRYVHEGIIRKEIEE